MAESQESFGFDMDFDIDSDEIFDSDLESGGMEQFVMLQGGRMTKGKRLNIHIIS